MNELIVQGNNALATAQTVDAGLFDKFIAFLDSSPKTVQTYSRA